LTSILSALRAMHLGLADKTARGTPGRSTHEL